jgi:hypothetical protein
MAREGETSLMAENIMPIRGGIDSVWSGFAQAVPDFRVEVVEVIPAEGDIVVVEAIAGGTMPADVQGIVKKGSSRTISTGVHLALCSRRQDFVPRLLLG